MIGLIYNGITDRSSKHKENENYDFWRKNKKASA